MDNKDIYVKNFNLTLKQLLDLSIIDKIKIELNSIITEFIKQKITITKIGSVKFLLFGPEKSKQSIVIKLGKILGEQFPKILINNNKNLKILNCGLLKLQNCKNKKDFDLIWLNNKNNTIYYRECKGNIQLDTEKLPATIKKIKELEKDLKNKYPKFKINSGIFNWSVFEREDLTEGSSHIISCEKLDINVDHFKDFLVLINIFWCKKDFYIFFRNIGKKINNF